MKRIGLLFSILTFIACGGINTEKAQESIEDAKNYICEYDGTKYEKDVSFKSKDGCNTCSCDIEGNVICTEKACAPNDSGDTNSSAKNCEYNGKSFKSGSNFNSKDGCNLCSCDDGDVICTEKACGEAGPTEDCPVFGAPSPDFCKDGVIVSGGKDEKGCQLPPECKAATCKDKDGKVYYEGQSFKDDCNTCSCNSSGDIVCTQKDCPCPPLPDLPKDFCKNGKIKTQGLDANGCVQAPICVSICTDGVNTYEEGDSFKKDCNTCSCLPKGAIACTKKACLSTLGDKCGALTGVSCDKGQFCLYSSGCGKSSSGICTEIAQKCLTIIDYVCGCDGKTYANTCTAYSAGVSVAAKGKCQSTIKKSCGGRLNLKCAPNEYCRYGKDCGYTDMTGTCETKPQMCNKMLSEVCGCDNKTYGNECTAAAAGISVKSSGKCKSIGGGTGQSCGGIAGIACKSLTEYCDYGSTCGKFDQMGTCKTKPSFCTKEYKPVCGCNGKTYGNSCSAASAGISVVSQGACP